MRTAAPVIDLGSRVRSRDSASWLGATTGTVTGTSGTPGIDAAVTVEWDNGLITKADAERIELVDADADPDAAYAADLFTIGAGMAHVVSLGLIEARRYLAHYGDTLRTMAAAYPLPETALRRLEEHADQTIEFHHARA